MLNIAPRGEKNLAKGALVEDAVAEYLHDGCGLARGMFDGEEIELLRRAAKEDKALDEHAFGTADAEGGVIRLSHWNHPGDGIYVMFARCRTLAESAEILLGGEGYRHHSKQIMKQPKVGSAWAWHQDYGYWCQNGVQFPQLCSVFISAKRLELAHLETEPGDVIFFHANFLHRGDQNRSEMPRWSMICCPYAARNDPYKHSHHPRYTPLSKVDDAPIKPVGVRRFAGDASNVSWLDPARNSSAESLAERTGI